MRTAIYDDREIFNFRARVADYKEAYPAEEEDDDWPDEVPQLPLRDYIRQAWPIVEPKRRYLHNWHIDAIADHLTAVTNNEIHWLIINVPPRHMKSLSVCVFWPTWEWTFAPWTRWLFASYGLGLSVRDSLKCRRLIQSNWYQEQWGKSFKLTSDQNQKIRFENDKTGYRIATSVDGMGTGEGGDRIVVDDPVKASDAYSEPIRTAANDWWDGSMSTRGNDPETASWVVIAQRLHEQDLPGHLLEEMEAGGERYELLILPAEYVPKVYVTAIGWQDPRTEPGELLWKDRFSAEEIAKLKRKLGARDAGAQLQQDPSPAEGDIFKRFWWRFWKPAGIDLPPVRVQLEDGSTHECVLVDLPEFFDEQIQSWDMTFNDVKTSAFVVGQVWARLLADLFLMDQHREKMDVTKTIKAVERMSVAWPQAHTKLVENKANGPAVVQMLRHKLAGLVEVNPEGGKISRANAAAPFVESGNVYLPHPHIAPWVGDFIEEHAKFPNSDYADQVDTETQAVKRLLIPKEQKPQTAPPRVVPRKDMFG